MIYYFGILFQLMGISAVGICFYGGLVRGNYGKIELIEFISGIIFFLIGHFLRLKKS